MEIYTLNRYFFPIHNIDKFLSLIWTERYYSAGDFQLVVPPTVDMITKLRPGTLVRMRGTKEVMIADTLSIDSEVMTVSGGSLVSFFNNRLAWFGDPQYDATGDGVDGSSQPRSSGSKFADFTRNDQTAGQFLSGVIDNMVIDALPMAAPWLSINLDWDHEKFPSLELGHIDGTGPNRNLSFPIGPLYDGLQQVAQAENVGFKLYLASADFETGTHVLKFATYRGKDRTSDQEDLEVVRFSPYLDNFTGDKETRSNVDYKNVVYVTYKNKVTEHYPSYVDPGDPPVNWKRRVIRVDAPDIHLDPTDGRVADFRERVATDTLRHQRTLRTVDGQVVDIPNNYNFPQDYYLGDLVEIQGKSGLIIKARVIEYVRSEDQYGFKAYPTFESLHPLDTTFIGDPTHTPDWTGEPVHSGTPPPDDTGPVDIPLTPTRSFEVPGWIYNTDIGYYVHQGHFYIVGEAAADNGDHLGSKTLFHIDERFAPPGGATSRVLVDHGNSTPEYAFDSGLEIGPWLDVDIKSNGDVVLHDGNPFRPSPGDDGSFLTLILSGITWPTRSAVTDSPTDDGSLDDYVTTAANLNAFFGGSGYTDDAWVNIDGGFAKHRSRGINQGRLHLHGHVEAAAIPLGIAPLQGMPDTMWPKLSDEDQPYRWCETPTNNGYRAFAYVDGAAMDQAYAQDPQSSGNLGSGFWKQQFFNRYSDGFIARASTAYEGFGFPTGTDDHGLVFDGGAGVPIGEPGAGDWRGNSFVATIQFHASDVIEIASDSDAPAACSGDEQICVVMGMHETTMNSYYKMSLCHNTTTHFYKWFFFYVVVDGAQTLLTTSTYTGPLPDPILDLPIQVSFEIIFSTLGDDCGFAGDTSHANYYWIKPPPTFSNNGNSHDLEAANGLAIPGAKGAMGIHLPTSRTSDCKIISAQIYGTGDWPGVVATDKLDLTGCGWPIGIES